MFNEGKVDANMMHNEEGGDYNYGWDFENEGDELDERKRGHVNYKPCRPSLPLPS